MPSRGARMHQGVVLAAIGIKNKEIIEGRVRVRGRMKRDTGLRSRASDEVGQEWFYM